MSAPSSGDNEFECLKQDSQKADAAEIPTYMWDHFFQESFMQKFHHAGPKSKSWRHGHPDVYKRRNPRERAHMPEGWQTALDGFRRLTVRRWRRNLL